MLSAFLALLTTNQSALAWELVKNKNDIFVYARTVDNSPYLEYKLETTFNNSIQQVEKLLGDGSACPSWYSACKEMHIAAHDQVQDKTIFIQLDFPWPLANRYSYVQASQYKTNNSITFIHTDTGKQYPTNKRKGIKMNTRGSYKLEQLAEQKTQFTWLIFLDPGAGLSPRLFNKRLSRYAAKDLLSLKKQLETN